MPPRAKRPQDEPLYSAAMHILITGGAGFIGSHVADACLAAGHDVTILDDLSTGRRENLPANAHFLEGDIRDAEWLSSVVQECRPDVVSHQAAQTSVAISAREPVLDADINVLGTLNQLNACVAQRVSKFVFASTGGAIYGEVPDGQRASLDWQPRPLSPYACSKFAIEGYLECYRVEHGLASTVLRYSNVYGPRQDPHGEAGVVAIFSQRALDGQPLSVYARAEEGDPGCVRDYVFVEDVVRANLMAIDDAFEQPIVNVCTGRGASTREIAEAIKRFAGSDCAIGFGPRRPGDVERSVLDPGSPAPLGETVSLERGLQQTVAWFGDDG